MKFIIVKSFLFILILNFISLNAFASENLDIKDIIFAHMSYETPKYIGAIEKNNLPKFYFNNNKAWGIMGISADQLIKMTGIDKYKVSEIISNEKSGFDAIVFEHESECVIVFSGTEFNKKSDIVENLNAVILNIVSSQENDAQNLLERIYSQNKYDKIKVIGYSLGGFLVQRVALNLMNKDDIIKSIEFKTFNSPGILSIKTVGDYAIYPNGIINSIKMNEFINAQNCDNINIKNYIIKGDIVGEFGLHIGEIIYINGVFSQKDTIKNHDIINFYPGVRLNLMTYYKSNCEGLNYEKKLK